MARSGWAFDLQLPLAIKYMIIYGLNIISVKRISVQGYLYRAKQLYFIDILTYFGLKHHLTLKVGMKLYYRLTPCFNIDIMHPRVSKGI
jgi:hypothetical protein